MAYDLTIAVGMCKTFEGFRSKPYMCPAGVPTIGFGSTFYMSGRRVTLNDPPISQGYAEKILLHELTYTYLPGVLRLCPKLSNDVSRLNAIVDFTYNLGVGRLQTSTLRAKLNGEDWDGAKEQLMRWVRGGSKVLPGLVLRRKAEAVLL